MAENLKITKPAADAHPLRFAVRGVQDTVSNLAAFVNGLDWDPDLQAALGKRILALKTNAAKLHVHEVARPDGGFDLHVTVSGVNFGAQAGSVVKKNQGQV